MSCSNHIPNVVSDLDVNTVSLSLPSAALLTINSASAYAGLRLSDDWHLALMSMADCTISAVGNPHSPAGYMPNALSAEKRPPTFSGVAMW